jgi:hypothetical protein
MPLSRYEEVERCALHGCAEGFEQLVVYAFEPRSFFKRRAREALQSLGVKVCDDDVEQEMVA